MRKYLRVWKQLVILAFGSYISNRMEYGSYFLGKIVRFGFFLLMIVAIFSHTQNIVGYSKYQVIIFFLTAFFMDSLGQAFFRGIYLFRQDVQRANFDYVLVKPVNPLFLTLTRMTDLLDITLLAPLIVLIAYSLSKLGVLGNPAAVLGYLLFVAIGFVIVASLHIISAALTVWTMESEVFIWFYRTATFAALFPPEIFSHPIQLLFTFIIPIVIIVAVPAKAVLGMLTLKMVLIAFAVAFVFLFGSLLLWKASLKQYSSASS
ncbi:MAG: ABC-2 family transporter protein [Parcubacteria group bacterium]|jgi:ABC-2 type transport system permease protein